MFHKKIAYKFLNFIYSNKKILFCFYFLLIVFDYKSRDIQSNKFLDGFFWVASDWILIFVLLYIFLVLFFKLIFGHEWNLVKIICKYRNTTTLKSKLNWDISLYPQYIPFDDKDLFPKIFSPVQTEFDILEGIESSLSKISENIDSSLDKIEFSIEGIGVNLEQLESSLSNINDAIISLESPLENIGGNLVSVEVSVDTVSSTLSDVDSTLNNINDAITSLESPLERISGNRE